MYKINMEIFFSLFLKWEQFFHNLYFWRFLNIYDWIIYLFIDDKLEFNWKIFFLDSLNTISETIIFLGTNFSRLFKSII